MSIPANHFVLQNANGSTEVDFATTSFPGVPILRLTHGGRTVTFQGSQVRIANTEIGMLVTVTTLLTVDTGSTSVSVLIPAITLASVTDHANFDTDAIITTHSGPIGVGSHGVHEKYDFQPMTGTASVIIA